MKYEIRRRGGHVEVLDEQGNFLFSADSEHEARSEMQAADARRGSN